MARSGLLARMSMEPDDYPPPVMPVAAAAGSLDDEAAEWEELIEALTLALAELHGEVRAAAFDEAKHPRGPGGKFRSTVDKLKHAIETHRSGGGKGDPFEGFDREQLRRAAKTRGITLGRGEDRDSIAKKLIDDLGGTQAPAKPEEPKPEPKKRTPRKRAPAKRAPAGEPKADAPARSGGTDLIGSDPASLAGRVAKTREHHQAADLSLSVIGQEQGFDRKPRVVSKAEMDQLVSDGNPEVFRGVTDSVDGSLTATQILEATRSGHAFYGTGIYGNGYYWGDRKLADSYAKPRASNQNGEVARAVIGKDAKVVDFWKDLEPEWSGFMESLKGRPDEAELRDVYGDPGRYAAARGYDAILVAPDSLDVRLGKEPRGETPWYNVLNRAAMVMEEAQ